VIVVSKTVDPGHTKNEPDTDVPRIRTRPTAPKKTKNLSIQPQQQAIMEEEQRMQANLRMLQRYGSWTEIIATATHVVLYEFQDGAWTKASKEGTLFFASPPAALIILNRTSTENFILNINGTIQIQHEQGYVILRVESVIYGLWFPSADERSRMFDLVSEAIRSSSQRPRAVSTSRPSTVTLPPPSSSLAEVGKLKAALGIGGGPSGFGQPVESSAPLVVPEQTGMTAATQFTLETPSTALPNMVAAAGAATAAATATTTTTGGPEITTEPLDKRSLQLALLSLVQDERFLDLIHTQYLRVVQRRHDKNDGK
jgi:mRNA-decapping enzyme 1B